MNEKQQNTAAYIAGFEDGKRVTAIEIRRSVSDWPMSDKEIEAIAEQARSKAHAVTLTIKALKEKSMK